jgi:hypothetical protein
MSGAWVISRAGQVLTWPSFRAFLLSETCWQALMTAAEAA